MFVNFFHLWILLVKNLRLQIRSPGWLVMEILFPILLILFCTLFPETKQGASFMELTLSTRPFYGAQNYSVLWSIQDNCCNSDEMNDWTTILNNYGARIDEATEKKIKQKLSGWSSFGVKIEAMDVGKKQLKYKLFTRKDYLETRLNMEHAAHLQIYGDPNARNIYQKQYLIETTFLQLVNNKSYGDVNIRGLPRPEKIELRVEQTFFYTVCPATLIMIIVFTTRNIVSERETILPYLSVMGLSTATFYLSHCIIVFLLILTFSLTHVILVFHSIPDFPWTLASLTMILFSLAVTGYAAMLGSFFRSSSTAIQLTICIWLAMSLTPIFVPPSPLWHTAFACVQSLWPNYALHYIFKYLVAVSDYGLGSWAELADSRWTGQAAIGPLLVLFLLPFLQAGIVCIFEKRLWRKIGNIWGKKRMNSVKSDEETRLLSDTDEKYDVDEKDADIVLKDVYKKYSNGVKAVNGLDMIALRGQVTVLLGHNGAGKTTTFSIICGVEEASGGTVEVGGYPAGSSESRKTIGYCAQVNTLIDQMTVKDHLWLAHGLKRAEGNYWDEGEQLLKKLGLENMRVKKLSGGQKRKLCVAMALIGNSQVVLLDEPTAGMDPESRRDVEKLLEEAKKERTILLTTHYMDEAETLGDRIFIMADGHGVCSGSPQFLKKRFGTGYLLTLVAGEGSTGQELAERMESLVQEYAASAKLGEIRGKQVEIAIPIKEQSHFPELFERIESSQKELHISNFGLSLNTLEQVFLHVCSFTDKEESKREVTLADAMTELYEERKREGFALYFHQFLAVLIKKFIYTIRFWSLLAIQIGLPLLSIIAVLVLTTIADIEQTNLSIKLPPGDQMFVQYDKRTQELENFGKLGAHTIGNGLEIEQYLLRNDLYTNTHFGMVWDTATNNIKLFFNAILPLAAAETINALSRVRCLDCSISLSLDILNTSDKEEFAHTWVQSALLFLPISITVCQLVVTIIEDRVSGFAHQQLLTGMEPMIYWLGEIFCCLIVFCFQSALYLLSATVIGMIDTLLAFHLLLLLLLYFWSIIPTIFLCSRFIKSSSKGALLLWFLLFGSFVLVEVIVHSVNTRERVMFYTEEWNFKKMTNLDHILLIFRVIFPSYTIVELMTDFIDYSTGEASRSRWSDGRVVDGSKEIIILQCICLFITGAVGLIFFFLIQQRHIRYSIFRVCKAYYGRSFIPEEVVIPQDSVRNAPEGAVILETTDMSKVYGDNCALAHLSMSVRINEIFGLLGVSGAGKTTAFNILTGQMFATQGTATIDGIDCRKKVVLGYCPQFDTIHKNFTGREALTLLARIHGYSNPKQTADRVLEMVKMTEHGKKRMARCSGGQKRRISVAASLLTTTSRIIILDEATAGIDPKARRDIWEVISAARNHAAVLMTSHSMDECEALCNRIGILKEGGLAIVGTSQSLKSRYGNFYTLTMALPSSDMKAKVTEEVANRFPGSILKSDGFSLHLKWQVPKKPTDRWSTVFASCLELSEQIGVADFCLTQSTLQDIFLLLAGHDPIPLEDVSIHQTENRTKPTTSATRTTSAEKTDVLESTATSEFSSLIN